MIEQHFWRACRDVLGAPKPGYAPVDDTEIPIGASDLLQALEAAAPELAREGASLAARIASAMQAGQAQTGRSVGCAAIAACVPLAAAAQRKGLLQRNVLDVLAEASASDTERVCQARGMEAPAGSTLRGTMRTAAEHDSVARLYGDAFSTLFNRMLPTFLRTLQRRQSKHWAITECYLRWLALWPDVDIVRRFGPMAGAAVQGKARALLHTIERSRQIEATVPLLREWDAELRTLDLNPRTTAELTIATAFAWQLRSMHEGHGALEDATAEELSLLPEVMAAQTAAQQ